MKLNIFNRWKRLGAIGGKTLEYQTSNPSGSAFVTLIRDEASQKAITKGYGTSKESSQKAAYDNLKSIGIEGILKAIETGQPVMPTRIGQPERKEIDWRDGSNHSYRAQKRIVGESLIPDANLDPSFLEVINEMNNPVAKHAHKFNKAVRHADKKKDYKRKEKHAKKPVEE